LNDWDSYWRTNPTTSIGVPQYYWEGLDNGTPPNQLVNFYPTPDTSGLAIIVTALQEPANVVNVGDGLPVPDEFMETIVRYCLQMAAEWGEDWQAAQWFKKDVEDRMGDDRHVQATRAGNSYPVIRDSPGEYW
jgi:hypothetical protein